MKDNSSVSFFFGASGRTKYCSVFGEVYDPFENGTHYILKGGPGCGKSTLMKKAAELLEQRGFFVERGYCSADPLSLDIIYAPEINFSILDGTSPHTFDPTLPGVTEHTVDLSRAWNTSYLSEHSEEIAKLTEENRLRHKKANDFLFAASKTELENSAICSQFTNDDKLRNYVRRLAGRLIPERKGAARGKAHKRFLSAISPDGIMTQYETVDTLAEKKIYIEDEFSVCAPFITEYIADTAVENGFDVYLCVCPLFPYFKTEHIIIPELSLCVFTRNSYHGAPHDPAVSTHVSRFFDKTAYEKRKETLKLNRKVKRELIDEAIRKLSAAKVIHDRLEEYYIKASDFEITEKITEAILKNIENQ